MRRSRFIRLAMIATLVTACGADARETAAAAADSATTDRLRDDAMPEPSADSLRLHLDVPAAVAPGEPVPMTLRIENITDRALQLHLVGRTITFDLIVQRADGTVVWRRLHNEIAPSILRLDPLPPGESIILEHTWDQRTNQGEPVGPGTYRVLGEVPVEGGVLEVGAVQVGIG